MSKGMLSNIKTQLGGVALADSAARENAAQSDAARSSAAQSKAGQTVVQTGAPYARRRSTIHPRANQCPICDAPFGEALFCARDGGLAGTELVVGGRYRLEETLGAGGTALVFGARHLALGKKVALKLLRPELAVDAGHRERFLREAQVASQLEHENIVRVLDFGEHEGLPYLAMDYVTGPTLADVLAEQKRIPWQEVVPVLTQILQALSVAHQQAVIHRDLSPKNVVLSESSGARNVVKLCDFGLSRVLDSDETRLTSTGVAMGTPAYMAPEQIRGDAEQDHRVDLYSFGTVAYELLTGVLPHQGNTVVALLASRLSEPPAPFGAYDLEPEVPAALEATLFSCLAIDPSDRPGSALEVEEKLRQLEAQASAPIPTDLVGQMAGNFRVMDRIGAGGMGSVYRAEHPVIGTQVAIKVIRRELATSGEALDRFIREARAASAINSPHIPRYLDFGRLPDGRAFAAMDYLSGRSLAEHLETYGPMASELAVSIIERVAATISKAHEMNILHRDIKPDNIFLEEDEQGAQTPKVLDFGIAKLLADGDAKQTRIGAFVGSPAYCAPEQAMGAAVLDAGADVYALGATLFEMLTGHPPFEGEAEDVLRAKVHHEAHPIRDDRPDIDDKLAAIVHKMIARDHTARYGTMDEVLKDLSAWRASRSTETLVSSLQPGATKKPGIAVASGLGLTAMIALLIWWLMTPGQTSHAPTKLPQREEVNAAANAVAAPAGAATPRTATSTSAQSEALDDKAADESAKTLQAHEKPGAAEEVAAEAAKSERRSRSARGQEPRRSSRKDSSTRRELGTKRAQQTAKRSRITKEPNDQDLIIANPF